MALLYGDNPDINYVPGETRRISVPRPSDTERSVMYADDLATREHAAQSAKEIEANAAAYRQQAIEARRRKTEAAKAKIGPAGVAVQEQQAEGSQVTAGALGALAAGKNVTAKVPSYGPNKRHVERMIGTPEQPGGLAGERVALQRYADAAALAQEQTAADALAETANRQGEALRALRHNEMGQAQRQQEQLDRIRAANDLSTKAADKFAEIQDIDPGRYWRNQPAFMKFIAAIAAGLKGWAGRADATSHITDAIAMDIDAQKAAIAKASQTVGDSRAKVQLEESLYGQILAQTGSEREADLIYTDALMNHAKSTMLAKLQAAGVQTLSRQQQIMFNELEQKHSEIKRQMEVTSASLTPTRTMFVPAIRDPLARKLVYEEGKLGQDMRKQAGGKAIDVAAAREAAAALAAGKASGDEPVAAKRLSVTSNYQLAHDTVTDQGVIDQVNDFEKRHANGIPGIPEWGGDLFRMRMTHEQKSAYYDMVNIITRSLRPETGAAYTEQEIDNASGGIINEGRSAADNSALQQATHMLQGANEDDVWHILGEVKKKHKRRIEHLQRPLSAGGLLDEGGIEGDVAHRPAETISKPSSVRLRGQ